MCYDVGTMLDFFLPIAEASGHLEASRTIIQNIQNAILFPLIGLLIAIAILVFVWGTFQYVMNAENDQAREVGRKHMLYGIIGFLIMVSAFSILTIARQTFGVPILQ